MQPCRVSSFFPARDVNKEWDTDHRVIPFVPGPAPLTSDERKEVRGEGILQDLLFFFFFFTFSVSHPFCDKKKKNVNLAKRVFWILLQWYGICMEKCLFQEGGNYFVTKMALCNDQRESVGVRLRF